MGPRRRRRARRADAARTCGAAPVGTRVHGPRAQGPYAAANRARERVLLAPNRCPSGRVAEPRSFLCAFGASDAADPRRLRPLDVLRQTRRASAARPAVLD